MIYFDGILWSWQKGGGVYRYFDKLISAVKARGLDTTFLLPKPYLRPGRHFPIVRAAFSLLHKVRLKQYFKKVTTGVFHSTYYTTYDSLKIPQVLTVHDMTYEKFPRLFADPGSQRFIKRKKLCIERADAIICVSRSTKESLQSMYGVPSEKIHVIYHGVDDYFNENYDRAVAEKLVAGNSLSKPFLLFVGNRAKYKNFEFFMRAFARWDKHAGYDIVALGGGVFTADEERLMKDLGIRNSVKAPGYVSDEELKTFYCLSKAFVFPSLDEGFGLPILEAICSGTRVIASDIPAFREIGHDIPIFFDPVHETSLIKAFDRVTTLPPLSPAEKSLYAERIKRAFSWERCFEETVGVYKNIIQK